MNTETKEFSADAPTTLGEAVAARTVSIRWSIGDVKLYGPPSVVRAAAVCLCVVPLFVVCAAAVWLRVVTPSVCVRRPCLCMSVVCLCRSFLLTIYRCVV